MQVVEIVTLPPKKKKLCRVLLVNGTDLFFLLQGFSGCYTNTCVECEKKSNGLTLYYIESVAELSVRSMEGDDAHLK